MKVIALVSSILLAGSLAMAQTDASMTKKQAYSACKSQSPGDKKAIKACMNNYKAAKKAAKANKGGDSATAPAGN